MSQTTTGHINPPPLDDRPNGNGNGNGHPDPPADVLVKELAQENQGEKATGSATSQLMTSPPQTVRDTDDIQRAAARMVSFAHKQLPVTDQHGRLVGVIAQREILRFLHDNGACAATARQFVNRPRRRVLGRRTPRVDRTQERTKSGEAVLGRAARGFRAAHALIAASDLVALGYLWSCALSRRRNRLLHFAVAALLAEGGALIVGRGNCPLGPLQRRLGDPVPLFELVLPPRAAKAAVPLLTAISAAGLACLASRPPSDTSS